MSPLPPNVTLGLGLPPNDAGYDIRDEQLIAKLSRAESAHFWHLSRNAFIVSHLRQLGVAPPHRILELGCGGGAVAAHLASVGYVVTGVDGHLPRIVEAAKRAPAAQFLLHDLRLGLPELGGGFDAVGLFDVIEHLDAPAEALREAASRLRPGGYLVGTVPALMALWSAVDERGGHRLRYDRRSLINLFAKLPGLRICQIRYFNRLLVPLMWMRRRRVPIENATQAQADDLAVPSPIVNRAMCYALQVEYAFELFSELTPMPGASLWFALQQAT